MTKEYPLDVIQVSTDSLRRFIKLFLGIHHTDYWFHQTLTFNEKIPFKDKANKYLKKLLDSLEKSYPDMAAVWVQGYQKKQKLHFHVIFLFFGQQEISPEEMRKQFGREVFRRWSNLFELKPFRKANLMTLDKLGRFAALDYLTVKQNIRPAIILKRTTNWHGIRNKKLISANSHPVSKKEVTNAFYGSYPKPSKEKPLPDLYTKANLKREREWIDALQKMEWEDWKKRELKTKKKVSNDAYINFKNKERDKMIRARSKKWRKKFGIPEPEKEGKIELDF